MRACVLGLVSIGIVLVLLDCPFVPKAAVAAAAAAQPAAATATGTAGGAAPDDPPPRHRDARIQRALDWLPRQPAVPVQVVDVGRLARRIQQEVRGACGFIIRGVARIYITSRCLVYLRAEHNPFDAIALAAVIAHEMAHLDGAGEAAARQVELDLIRQLASHLPGHYQVRAAAYSSALRQRKPPVACETIQAGPAFHACAAHSP